MSEAAHGAILSIGNGAIQDGQLVVDGRVTVHDIMSTKRKHLGSEKLITYLSNPYYLSAF
jgi:hypothetical protein